MIYQKRALIVAMLLCILTLGTLTNADAQSIVGFWDWEDGQLTVIYPNGTFVVEGETQGTWTHTGGSSYILKNQRGFIDELKLTNNGTKLKGKGHNKSNPRKTWRMTCTRVTGDPIIGFWKWADGQTTVIKPNGTFDVINEASGNWIKSQNGVYTLQNSAGFTDKLTLSKSGQILSGIGFKSSNPNKQWKMRCKRF